MSLSISNSQSMYSTLPVQGAAPAQVGGSNDPDGDGDGGRVHHGGHHGRGGQVQQAMLQALQSMGSSLPQQTGSSATADADKDGDSNGATAATGSVKSDMRQFMHALFQAIKGEKASLRAAHAALSYS